MAINKPLLEESWLAGFRGSAAPDLLSHEKFEIILAVEKLDYVHAGEDRATCNVELALMLDDASDTVCSVASTFRLIYRMEPLLSSDAEREFAVTRALRDAWPIWRSWLVGSLAGMGLGPPPIPARLPLPLVAIGRDAFDGTRALAAKRSSARKKIPSARVRAVKAKAR